MTVVVPINVTTAQEYQDALEKAYDLPTNAALVASLDAITDAAAAAQSTADTAKVVTDKMVVIKPAATVNTHAEAVALAASSLVAGELIQTVEYTSGTGRGARIMQLFDAGSSGARPADFAGLISHVTGGSGGLYLKTCYIEEEVIPWELSSVNLALLVARALGQTLKLTHGDYQLSSKLLLQSNDKLFIAPSASLTATAALTNSTMIEVGTLSSYADYFEISGGGRINAAGLAYRAIDVLKGRFSKISDLDVDGATINGIRLGNVSADDASYEIHLNKINMMHEQVVNGSSSVGVLHAKCNDSFVDRVVVVGYRRSFEVGSASYSVKMSNVHGWGRAVHGILERSFSIFGKAKITGATADTPFDFTGGTGDLYGFYLSSDAQCSDLTIYLNNSLKPDASTESEADAMMDGRITPIRFGGSNNKVVNVRVHGGEAARRYKQYKEDSGSNNEILLENKGDSSIYVTAP